jgi:hypothetical protein
MTERIRVIVLRVSRAEYDYLFERSGGNIADYVRGMIQRQITAHKSIGELLRLKERSEYGMTVVKGRKHKPPEDARFGYTDAGEVRVGNTGANLGWSKNKANMDIREAMKEKNIGQVKLARLTGRDVSKINRMLKNPELAENIRQAILETIKRYDPETDTVKY